MGIWPWRSRPVVTPFTDDFSADVLCLHENVSADTLEYVVPDNLYLTPLSYSVQVTAGAGVRSPNPSRLFFTRSGCVYAAGLAAPYANTGVYWTIFSPGVDYRTAAGVPSMRVGIMPFPLYVYPHDIITIHMPCYNALDLFNNVSLHAQVWEVH